MGIKRNSIWRNENECVLEIKMCVQQNAYIQAINDFHFPHIATYICIHFLISSILYESILCCYHLHTPLFLFPSDEIRNDQMKRRKLNLISHRFSFQLYDFRFYFHFVWIIHMKWHHIHRPECELREDNFPQFTSTQNGVSIVVIEIQHGLSFIV